MVLTSLSTEQLIGVNAVSYQNNFSIIAWTVPTVIPLCFLALYMLPKYLRNGYTTIPEFFENRFDRQTRLIMSGLFLVFYLLIVIPTALYTGAIAFNKIFNLETIFGLSYAQAIVYTVIAIGVVGAIYAIFGGLKAVAVSDTINAVILVIGALLVPIFALLYLGNGSISEGLNIITTTHVEKWNALVAQQILLLGRQFLPVLWLFTSSIGQRTKPSYNVFRGEGFSIGSKRDFNCSTFPTHITDYS